jgi:hypothetical protein
MSAIPAQAPFTALGNLQGYVDHQGPHEWRANAPFRAALDLTEVKRGISSARFCWTDRETGITYPMLLADIADVLANCVLIRGTITGWWIVGQRGKNFGLRRATKDLLAASDHTGGNAEDCPACSPTTPAYPFLCPATEALA